MGRATSTCSSRQTTDAFPPLLFDLSTDTDQTHNLLLEGGEGVTQAAWQATQELLQWQMRTAERTLSGTFLHPQRGLVQARDTWR